MEKCKYLQDYLQLDDYWAHDAYRTGYYEIFRKNGENLFSYNINSLYSYVMKMNDYPVMTSTYWHTEEFKEGYLGIYKICVKKYKPKGLPAITIKDKDNKPLFVEGENFVVTLTSNEMEYALSNSYIFDFKIFKGIFFTKKDKLFKKAIYNEEKFLELITNSKFATKEKKKKIIYTEDSDIIAQNINKIAIRNGKAYLIEWIDTDIVIASFITANARIEMIKKANTLLEAGFDVYYMNSDSIITNAKPEEIKKIGIKINKSKPGTMKVKHKIEHFEEKIQMVTKNLPHCLPDGELPPSQVTDGYWIYAYRQIGHYPKDTVNSGKWLIFIDFDKLDDMWFKIKRAVEEGKLGSSAKTSTALHNPNAGKNKTKVICVYTYDWSDEEDVMRIREELRKLGVTWKIPYKADKDTIKGNYTKDGKRRISKYYV